MPALSGNLDSAGYTKIPPAVGRSSHFTRANTVIGDLKQTLVKVPYVAVTRSSSERSFTPPF